MNRLHAESAVVVTCACGLRSHVHIPSGADSHTVFSRNTGSLAVHITTGGKHQTVPGSDRGGHGMSFIPPGPAIATTFAGLYRVHVQVITGGQ
ncbi:hypothetical protein BvCmsJ76A_05039 [Escherichia coli]|nr:hypothetical protein BvCmsJ76A_05039 [Escherichia coli]GCP85996.1 hypothetical protein BvCmsHHP033_03135 [Escherichia coli]